MPGRALFHVMLLCAHAQALCLLRPLPRRAALRATSPIAMESLKGTSDFKPDVAVLAAGFAFEAYNEPAEQDARWAAEDALKAEKDAVKQRLHEVDLELKGTVKRSEMDWDCIF